MSYSVKLTDEVKRRVSAWNLSSHVIREFLKALDQLGTDPDRRLIRVGPPDDALQYDVVIREPGDPPRDYLFALSVVYEADEETLSIFDCKSLCEGPDPE
jgi:hypothetical protein